MKPPSNLGCGQIGTSPSEAVVASWPVRCVRPWTSPRARPGVIDIDFGECLPQPFLALLPDPISFGLGI
jgi:hypothetical protein